MYYNNYLSRSGAETLARQIEDYWLDRGYFGIVVAIEKMIDSAPHVGAVYGVKTNIGGDGYPPIMRARAEAAA